MCLFKTLNKKDETTPQQLEDVVNLPLEEAILKSQAAGLNPVPVPGKSRRCRREHRLEDRPCGANGGRSRRHHQRVLQPRQGVEGSSPRHEYDPGGSTSTLPRPDSVIDENIVLQENPTSPPGIVLSQDPPADPQQKQDVLFKLVVSKSKDQVVVPHGGRPTGADAKSAIGNSFGLLVTLVDEPNDTVPIGSVIRTEPARDTAVDRGTPITVFVSTGPRSSGAVSCGITEAQARNLLMQKA